MKNTRLTTDTLVRVPNLTGQKHTFSRLGELTETKRFQKSVEDFQNLLIRFAVQKNEWLCVLDLDNNYSFQKGYLQQCRLDMM